MFATQLVSRGGLLLVALAVATLLGSGSSESAVREPRLYVAVDGSDSSACTRYRPCRTLQLAYSRARPGDLVSVAPGDYPAQRIRGTKSRKVLFLLDRKTHIADLAVHADNLEVRGGKIDDVSVHYDSSGFVSRNTDRGVMSVWGADNTSFIGGDAGPSYDPGETFRSSWISFDTLDGTLKEPTNVLIDGVYIHDYRKPTPGAHTQCIFIVGGNGITIRNSRFARCDVFDIYFGTPWFGDDLPPVRNVNIENNFFDTATLDGKYGGAYYSIRFAGDWSDLRNIRIAYNSAKQGMSFGDPDTQRTGFAVVANLMPLGECFAGIQYRYNVSTDRPCGRTDKRVSTLGFLDPARLNLRVRTNSAAVDAGDRSSFPRRDIYGRARPAGRAPDAGAVETR